MRKLLVPLFAAILVFAVGFVLFELHAPLTPATDDHPSGRPSAFAPPPSSTPAATPTNVPPRPERPPTMPPLPRAAAPGAPDPADVVVDGKTRREWHVYYADRRRKTTIEILRYQTIIDRAIAGEEPDPKELGEAHDHVRELNDRLKEDVAALQRIDGTP